MKEPPITGQIHADARMNLSAFIGVHRRFLDPPPPSPGGNPIPGDEEYED
jgi:hypothetical protein